MCGICGFVGSDSPDLLIGMRDALTHRGPDEAGSFSDGHVSLGHRRLSIIDLTHGQQPTYNEDRSIVVVFNGEIYNHRELRPALEARGHVYGSNSDTESIVHAYETYGTHCVQHLDGMFAFVLYDRRKRLLFGARDRMGKKPLYYVHGPADSYAGGLRFAFASEPKALLRHPVVSAGRALSRDGLISYLLNDYVVGAASIYDGIHRLEPGCAFVYGLPQSEQEGFRTWRYWNLRIGTPSVLTRSEREAGEQVFTLLSAAVERRLMSDVPLGVFLSGGIDSSAVVALLCRYRPAREIKTFSIGFDDRSFDESGYAERTARYFGTDHHLRCFTAEDSLRRIETVARMLDEPFADPSILPVSLLCEFARETVTVALGGDGGDELFAGYDPFKAIGLGGIYHHGMPPILHRRLVEPMVRWLPASHANMAWQFKISRFLRGAMVEPEYRMATWMGAFSLPQLRRLLPDLAASLTPAVVYEPMITAHTRVTEGGGDAIDCALDFFERFYLPDDILFKVDRASMMHSLEVRAPFLDRALVEYVNALPHRMKLRGQTTKYLLKRVLTGETGVPGVLPRDTVYRRKKGFGIPVARWIREDLRDAFHEGLVANWPKKLDMFDSREIEDLFQSHVRGHANHYKELWALFMLSQWARNFL